MIVVAVLMISCHVSMVPEHEERRRPHEHEDDAERKEPCVRREIPDPGGEAVENRQPAGHRGRHPGIATGGFCCGHGAS